MGKGWGKGNTTETNRGREGLINKEAGLERTKRLEHTGNQGLILMFILSEVAGVSDPQLCGDALVRSPADCVAHLEISL